MKAARVHYAHRRRGSVAAGGADVPVVGFLSGGSLASDSHLVASFRKGLSDRLCREPKRGDRMPLGGGLI